MLNSGHYIIGTSHYPCSYNLAACLNCTADGLICTVCSAGHYLSAGVCTACSSISTTCIKCEIGKCLACQLPDVLINQTLCSLPVTINPSSPDYPCTDPNCFNCSRPNVDNCLTCKSRLLTLINGRCLFICGDGLIAGSEVCDDGNAMDYDGCSSDCLRIDDGFTCNQLPSNLTGYSVSDCFFNRKIDFKVLSIKKPIKEKR